MGLKDCHITIKGQKKDDYEDYIYQPGKDFHMYRQRYYNEK